MITDGKHSDQQDLRFAFGENWRRFSEAINEDRVGIAVDSLYEMLGKETIRGKTFLDAGCGSGLFSLAAVKAGALKVRSFDYDAGSVSTAIRIKERFNHGTDIWHIERGDVLNRQYLRSLGTFDIVYSWGVLHHTGSMWKAFENISESCAPGGRLFIAIYNDQGIYSSMWKAIKKAYNVLPGYLKYLVLLPVFVRLWGPAIIKDLVRLRPLRRWNEYFEKRGMSPWHDVVDWVGGWPFEVASREKITSWFEEKGFRIMKTKSCGRGHGNNEFVFVKKA